MLKTFCDYCKAEVKNDRFILTIQKNNSDIAAAKDDLCMACKNKLSGFLQSLGTEEN